MLDPPLKSNVFTQPFFDHLVGQFQLDPFGNHGIEHWLRVLINGREIAKRISVNLKVIELFALIHDCRRWNELEDSLHGQRAAEFCDTLKNRWFAFDDTDLRLLRTACRYHTNENFHPNATVQACWDADRLDLGRIGIRPSKERLGAYLEKHDDLVQAAIARSRQSFSF